MNMITKADIEANKPVIVKWDKPLQSSGAVTDGVMAGQASEFITRIEHGKINWKCWCSSRQHHQFN